MDVFDRGFFLVVALVGVLVLCGWMWFQVTYGARDEAEVWLKVHQVEIANPRWRDRDPGFRDYLQPRPFESYEFVGESVPKFWVGMADRRARFTIDLSRPDRRGKERYLLDMADQGSLILSNWKPVLFMPKARVRGP